LADIWLFGKKFPNSFRDKLKIVTFQVKSQKKENCNFYKKGQILGNCLLEHFGPFFGKKQSGRTAASPLGKHMIRARSKHPRS
jgi:hypothetical protein